MFGQGGGQQGGFGFGTGGAKFGSGAGGEVKWGSAARSQQQQQDAGRGHAPKSGGSVFGRISSPPGASGFGGGRSGGGGGRGAYPNSKQQGRGGRSPYGGGRSGPQKQQSPSQQQQQQRSPLLSKLGSVTKGFGFWGTGAAAGGQPQQQQQQDGRGGGRFGAAAAAAAAAAATATTTTGGGRGSAGRWGGRSNDRGGRTGGSRGGRQQHNPSQQYEGQGRGRGGGRGSKSWNLQQQQQQQQQFGRTYDEGRGGGRRGGGRRSGGPGGVFSRLGGPAYNDEDMSAAEWHEQEELQEDNAGAAQGQAWQEEEAWQGEEEDMQDMEAEEAWQGQGEGQFADGDGADEQQDYDGDEVEADQQGDEGDYEEEQAGAADADGVLLSEQQLEAAKAAALAAIPKFIGGGAGSSGTARPAAAVAATGFAAMNASKPPASAGFRFKASPGAPPSPSYDTLEAAAGSAAAVRAARGTAGALQVEPRCNDMCPAAEREQRTADRQLHDFERIHGHEYATDAEHAVKKYTRSEAGGLPDPALLRTWPALKKTLVHLRHLMGQVGSSQRTALLEAHRFLWDRYRSVRKDITQTELPHKGTNQLLWVIAANEEMARFMILADAYLADKDKVNTAAKTAKAAAATTKRTAAPRITFNLEQFERDAEAAAAEAAAGAGGGFQPDPYDGHLNHQELTKTLLDLSALYREAGRMGVSCPHEAEFLSYYLILSRGTFGSFKASTANVVRLLNQMSTQVLASPHVQFALALSGALSSTNYAQLFRLLEGAPLLLAAAGQVYVPRLRSQALVCLLRTGQPGKSKATSRGVKQVPLELYASLLRFDGSSQALGFAMRHKEAGCSSLSVVDAAGGTQLLEVPSGELHTLQELREPPRHCLPWLLAKAGSCTLPELVTQPCPEPNLAALGLMPGGQGMVRVPRPLLARTPQPAAAAAATPRQAKVTSAPQTAQQQQVSRQQQQQAAFDILAKAGAAKQQPSQQQVSFQVPVQQQQQQVLTSASAAAGKRARGSTDSLPSMMPPAAAAATATAVFGGIAGAGMTAAAAGAGKPPMYSSSTAHSAGAPAHIAQQFAAQQQQQMAFQQQQLAFQQQQPSGAGLASAGLNAIHQPQQQQQQQLQSQAVAAAIAAEQQRSAELARQLAERNAEIARERELRRRSDTELRLIKQEIELKSKCEDAARWMWMHRWRSAAAAAKAARLQRQKEDEALAAADATLGRARKRRSLATSAAVTELELLQLQELEKDDSPKRARNGSYEAAVADLSPAPVEHLIARQLAAAPAEQQPACQALPEQIYLPGLASSSSRRSQADAHCCPPAGLVYKLLLISGYRDEDESMRPPLYQRRMANWLRHKFAPYRPPQRLAGRAATLTAGAAAAGLGAARQQQAVLVPLGGEQQQAGRSQDTAMSATATESAAAVGRQVWRLGPHAELLLSKSLPLPGNEQQQLLVEVLDLVGSDMASAAGSSRAVPVPVCAGAAGVMLLVSGPAPAEIAAAVNRLMAVLQCTAPAATVQVPLMVLAASEPSTQREVESRLKSAMEALMPADVYSRLSGGKVFCLGASSNGTSPAAVLRDALVYAAQEAPQLPRMRHVDAAGHLLDCLTVLTMPQAAALVPAGDVLAAYVAAHNMALSSMQQGLQEQLQSDAVRWGYPPEQSTEGAPPQQQLQLVLSQLTSLQLPQPPPLQQQQQWSVAGATGSSEHPALMQLKQYLNLLTQGPIAEAAGGVTALLLEARLPQLTASGGSGWQQHEQQQQQYNAAVSQLVVASCVRLLEQLQLKLSVGRLTLVEDALRWLREQYWEQQQEQRQQQCREMLSGEGRQQQQTELLLFTRAAASPAQVVQHTPLHVGAAAAAGAHIALPSSESTPLSQKIGGVAVYADGWQNSMEPTATAAAPTVPTGAAHRVTGASSRQVVRDDTQQRIQAELAAANEFLASTPGSWLKAVLSGRP